MTGLGILADAHSKTLSCCPNVNGTVSHSAVKNKCSGKWFLEFQIACWLYGLTCVDFKVFYDSFHMPSTCWWPVRVHTFTDAAFIHIITSASDWLLIRQIFPKSCSKLAL